MKHIKTYEENINEPKVGDYVILQDNGRINKFETARKMFNAFLFKNIGQIISKGIDLYKVAYDVEPPNDVLDYAFYRKNDPTLKNIPNIKIFQANYTNVTSANSDEIIYFAPTKEEIEIILNSRKYNI